MTKGRAEGGLSGQRRERRGRRQTSFWTVCNERLPGDGTQTRLASTRSEGNFVVYGGYLL